MTTCRCVFAGVALVLSIGCGKAESDADAQPGAAGKGAGGASHYAGASSAGELGQESSGGVGNVTSGTTSSGGVSATGGNGDSDASSGGSESTGSAGLGGSITSGGAPVMTECESARVHMGNLDLNRQAQLFDLPPISEIDGDLHIVGGVAQLDRLACLRRVTGSVTIQINPELTSLQGLENLVEVGGDLLITKLTALRNLSSLSSLRTVRGNLDIAWTEQLEEVSLPRLVEVSGWFHVYSLNVLDRIELPVLARVGSLSIIAFQLSTLSGLSQLEELESFEVSATRLKNLEALSNLKVVHQDFIVTDTPEIESLGRLGLRDVGRLIIENNHALLDLGELPLERVRQISIVRNHSLRSLPTFERLQSVLAVDVSWNAALPHCQAQALVARAAEQSMSLERDNLGSGPCN